MHWVWTCCVALEALTIMVVLLGSLRVNLDMGKAAYGWMIMKDENIPGTVVRTSTIPEELGRLVYLLTDKTGTVQLSLSFSGPHSIRAILFYTYVS